MGNDDLGEREDTDGAVHHEHKEARKAGNCAVVETPHLEVFRLRYVAEEVLGFGGVQANSASMTHLVPHLPLVPNLFFFIRLETNQALHDTASDELVDGREGFAETHEEQEDESHHTPKRSEPINFLGLLGGRFLVLQNECNDQHYNEDCLHLYLSMGFRD